VDREELHSVLVAGEALCSTGIGNGVAIPHPRGPIDLGIAELQVSLGFLRKPIEFVALDKKPVSILFVIVSTTVHVYLLLLSHLMYGLQDQEFRRLLDAHATHGSNSAGSTRNFSCDGTLENQEGKFPSFTDVTRPYGFTSGAR
jgi:PTS system nitrogen regulatory IIA component